MNVNYNFKLKPFDHQKHALNTGWDRIEFGLFMEMGTGKSKVLIDNMGMLYQAGLIDFALVIAPKGVYRNWVAKDCLLYTSPSPRDRTRSRMPSSA